MDKKVYIIHGWGGSPEEGIHKWLKAKLEEKGVEVVALEMPHPNIPTIEDWVKKLNEVIKNPDHNTILVGHSIGCQTILRYLEQLNGDEKFGKVILLAPFFVLTDSESDTAEEKEILKPWIETTINEVEVLKHVEKMVTIFSDDDPVVPMEENIGFFKEKFDPEIIIEHNKGHFSEDSGVTEVPVVLEAVLH